MTPEQFRQQTRPHRTAEPVLRVFRTQVLPRVHGPDLVEYLRAIMAKAKNLNEGLGALDEAIPLWCEVYAHNDEEGKEAVIRTLMSVASSRLGGREELVQTDVPAAVRLYEAAFKLDHSADQNMRVIKTMMSAANRFSETSGPATAMNIVAAVQLWTSAWRLHLSDDDQLRIVRTMMDIANRLSNTDTPARIDIDNALRIWKGLASLGMSEEAHERLHRTMMDVANRLRDLGRVDDVIAIWRVVHELETDADSRMRVIKTMMSFANESTDATGSWHDVPAAIRLWDAVDALSTDESEHARVAATMMAVAGRFADVGALGGALLIWRAVAKREGALPIHKSILARGAEDATFRQSLLPALETTNAFDIPLHAALLYYEGRFDDVIAAATRSNAPPAVRALHGDALRKLKRYDEAIKAARMIVDQKADTPERQDAKVSALTCIGYCFLEKAKAGEAVLDKAEKHLDQALKLAEASGLPVPPRVFNGLGYVYQLQRRGDDAQAAFERARHLDTDNAKATDALATPSPHLRSRPYDDLPRITSHPHAHGGEPTVAGLLVPAALRRLVGASVEGLSEEDVAELLEYAARVAEKK